MYISDSQIMKSRCEKYNNGSNVFSKILFRLTLFKLPYGIKNRLLLGSILGMVLNTDDVNNTKLLACFKWIRPECDIEFDYGLAVYLHKKIWGKKFISTKVSLCDGTSRLIHDIDLPVIDDIDIDNISKNLSKNIPGWLRYGTEKWMSADIEDFLRDLRNSFSTMQPKLH